MKNDIILRAYDPASDLKTLSNIWFDASLKAHAFLGEPRLRAQQTLIETTYPPAAETIVACHRERPVGFISLLDTFVGGLFVAPGQQGRGIGRTLIAEALALKGELVLEVYTRNAEAFAFYGALGFAEISRRPSDDEGLPFENARLRLKA